MIIRLLINPVPPLSTFKTAAKSLVWTFNCVALSDKYLPFVFQMSAICFYITVKPDVGINVCGTREGFESEPEFAFVIAIAAVAHNKISKHFNINDILKIC
jgi:hypothetical protein